MASDRLLECLLAGGVDFVIIGGVAAVLHGVTLTTRDLDVCVPLGAESLLKLQSALEPLHPRVRAGADWVPLKIDRARADEIKNLYISTDEGRLDCLGFVTGVGDFAAVHRESVDVDLGGRACRVLGIGALIRSKESAGRPHDQEAVIQLKAIQERRGYSE